MVQVHAGRSERHRFGDFEANWQTSEADPFVWDSNKKTPVKACLESVEPSVGTPTAAVDVA